MNEQEQDSEVLFAAARGSAAIQSLMIMVVFVEGSMARVRRALRTANPYQRSELASSAWFSGWDDGRAHLVS
jgi:hypothetical protein